MTFGEILKEYRQTRGLTQLELGSRAKLYPSRISDIEHGVVRVGYNVARRLCKVLGMDFVCVQIILGIRRGDSESALNILKEGLDVRSQV